MVTRYGRGGRRIRRFDGRGWLEEPPPREIIAAGMDSAEGGGVDTRPALGTAPDGLLGDLDGDGRRERVLRAR